MLTRSWRGPATGPAGVPLPPERMPLVRGGRPLKRWTYVGAYGPDLMLCAARARIGVGAGRVVGGVGPRARPAACSAPRAGAAASRSARRGWRCAAAGGARAGARRRRADRGRLPARAQYVWTRKRGGVRGARLDRARRRRRELDLRAIVDESAGYHARHTAWRWSAGVGVAGVRRAGRVEPRRRDPRRARGVRAHGLGRRRAARGRPGRVRTTCAVGGLRFTPEATRARRENLLAAALRLRAAVRHVRRRAARGRAAARGLGRDGAPRRALVTREPPDRGGCSARMRPMSRIALLAAVAVRRPHRHRPRGRLGHRRAGRDAQPASWPATPGASS